MYKAEERMIKVTDDWYPCYNNSEVRLRIMMLYHDSILTDESNGNYVPKGGYVKIGAYGADDFYVEKEYSISCISFDGHDYIEKQYLKRTKKITSVFSDESGEEFKRRIENRYNYWKENIFDVVPDGVDARWFLENGFIECL